MSGWRLDYESTILLFVAALVVAGIFAVLLLGCAKTTNPACGDDKLLAIQTACVAREVELGCDSDPVNLCPELVADCEKRIHEWEVCR